MSLNQQRRPLEADGVAAATPFANHDETLSDVPSEERAQILQDGIGFICRALLLTLRQRTPRSRPGAPPIALYASPDLVMTDLEPVGYQAVTEFVDRAFPTADRLEARAQKMRIAAALIREVRACVEQIVGDLHESPEIECAPVPFERYMRVATKGSDVPYVFENGQRLTQQREMTLIAEEAVHDVLNAAETRLAEGKTVTYAIACEACRRNIEARFLNLGLSRSAWRMSPVDAMIDAGLEARKLRKCGRFLCFNGKRIHGAEEAIP